MEIKETDRGLELEVILKLPHALHSRPSARLAQKAREYKSDILLTSESGEVDAKSMLDILSLAPKRNDCLRLIANGPDAREAILALAEQLSCTEETKE